MKRGANQSRDHWSQFTAPVAHKRGACVACLPDPALRPKAAMVNRALIRTLENDPDIESMFEKEVANFEEGGLFQEAGTIGADFEVNKIVEGRILRVEEG